ncbi:hypothetical protein BU24DRAFT_129178 [Aaosphaeria arxii CBS 175.79]|uniref:Uncharacterized protein n=1 Tax=Aaosphaeria arxii CBS 175.79 TaxID=1450172 RepID=A0A6A5Y2Y7_9PLEO|nr:uncharacterized protein BU24DRAFT_129178 [Aaosphaeria arxii CBS 175.79]KAF2019912.1 hypothetical protein BU24DRAFT_129178 [Aaosphaeria arxii CBS 175.79]
MSLDRVLMHGILCLVVHCPPFTIHREKTAIDANTPNEPHEEKKPTREEKGHDRQQDNPEFDCCCSVVLPHIRLLAAIFPFPDLSSCKTPQSRTPPSKEHTRKPLFDIFRSNHIVSRVTTVPCPCRRFLS